MKLIEVIDAEILKPNIKVEQFEVYPGDIVKLAGPSGIGKSSFLLSLVKLKKMTYKDIRIFGYKFRETTAEKIRSHLIYIPQLSGSESTQVKEVLDNLDGLNRNTLLEEFVEFDISNIENKRLDQLSGGERQIFNLLVSMNLKRDIILCDESFSAIDEERATKLIKKLLKWKGDKRAIIYVSHQNSLLDKKVNSTFIFSQEAEITTLKKN